MSKADKNLLGKLAHMVREERGERVVKKTASMPKYVKWQGEWCGIIVHILSIMF